MLAPRSKSSFYGLISEIPGIAVDNFEHATSRQSRAYFLSHCHTDHTQGLNTDELFKSLKSTSANIYMSEPTKAIIQDELGIRYKFIQPYVKSLDVGRHLITLPATSELDELIIYVSLVPAGHCFGSVMFLFQTNDKTVLFTGDFRVDVEDVRKLGLLHTTCKDPVMIDVMYVDTTFISDFHKFFPKRSESVDYIIKEIREWCGKNKQNTVALHTSAKYGYEFVFNEIYEKLNMRVYVDESRWNFYSNLHHLVPGVTNNESENQLHICRNRTENYSHAKCLPENAQITPNNCLYIHFSALKWSEITDEESPFKKLSYNRIDVCFATHCSRQEVVYFVNYFSPRHVVGFPNKYDIGLDRKRKVTPEKDFSNKSKVKDRKVDSKVLRDMFG